MGITQTKGKMFDLIIKDGLSFLPHPDGSDDVVEERVDIGVKDSLIKQIGSLYKAKAKETFSAKNLYVLPGLIDTQVHFREPGLEHKENLRSGSLSALKGGISAFFEMPNTKPPTAHKADLEEKIQRAREKSFCDFAFYLAVVPENISSVSKTERLSSHCPGAKLFLGNSTGNLELEDENLLNQFFSGRKGITAVHAEDGARLKERRPLAFQKPPHARNHSLWRDEETALLATKKAVALAHSHKAPVHILHISTKQEMEFLKNHKDIASLEVTPQHLTLTAPDCYERLSALAQMNPPIRDKSHQEALWKAVQSGLVDMIGSDHAPHTLEEKQKPYPESPSGMPGAQSLLPLMLDHVNKGRLDLKTLVRLLAHNPAKRFRIKSQGMIKEGLRANFTLVDLQRKLRIESSWLSAKCKWSPFEGMEVTGRPLFVFLGGKPAMAEGEVSGSPSGKGIEFEAVPT